MQVKRSMVMIAQSLLTNPTNHLGDLDKWLNRTKLIIR